MANMPWLRLYTEIRTDPKMLALSDTEFRIWINMLCLAAESKDRGVICVAAGIAYPMDALARALFVDTQSLQAALTKFVGLQMVEIDDSEVITISHFLDRQYDKQSARPDAVRDRVQRHRSRKPVDVDPSAPVDGNANVTPMKRPSNAIDTDTDSESETDESVPPNPPLAGGQPECVDKQSQKPTRSRKGSGKRNKQPPASAKIAYAEYVHMTEDEYKRLVAEHGLSDTLRMIQRLDNYKGASGTTYSSDYRAILSWVVDRVKEDKAKEKPPRASPDGQKHADRKRLYDDVYET